MSDTRLTPVSTQLPPTPDGARPGGLSRRDLMIRTGAGAGAVVAAGVLAACSSDSGTAGGGTGSGGAGGDSATAVAAGQTLAQLTDIPVGGTVVVIDPDNQPIAISQLETGVVTAVSAICTHQGCTVIAENSELVCPCHNSIFTPGTGAVTSGPAKQPLPAVEVHVADGAVVSGPA